MALHPLARILLWGQGLYFLLTGIWPLVDIGSFQAVTGPKVDLWLVKTVGVVVAAIGTALLMAARRRRVAAEMWLVAVLSAAGLAVIDIYYVSVGRISPIYLADAAAEGALIFLWLLLLPRLRRTAGW